MQTSCQNCNTLYNINQNLLLPSGKKVRCKRCGHVWIQLPENFESQNIKKTISQLSNNEHKFKIANTTSIENHNTQPQENTPTKLTDKIIIKKEEMMLKKNDHDLQKSTTDQLKKPINKPYRFFLEIPFIITMIIIMVILFSSIFQDKLPYNIKKFYRTIGIYSTNNIALINPTIQFFTEDNNVNIIAKGAITNLSKNKKFLPGIYITFYNKNKKKILSQKILDEAILLLYKQNYKFEVILNDIPKESDTIQLKIGNPLEVRFY